MRYPFTLPARNEDQLQQELDALGLSTTLALAGSEDVVEVLSSRDLTSEEQQQVEAAVTAHVPVATTEWQRRLLQQRLQTLVNSLDSDLGVLIQALALALLDGLNQVRQSPATTFPVITGAAARQAIRDKVVQLLS